MKWDGKRVLVTGAAGFIGSHLCEALTARGAKVSAFLRYKSDGDLGLLKDLPTETLRGLTIMRGDLKDRGRAIEDRSMAFDVKGKDRRADYDHQIMVAQCV